MQRRHFSAALGAPVFMALLLQARMAQAQGLAGITELDASRGLKTALELGASTAVKLLGAPGGFLSNPRVHIPLPGYLQDASKLLKVMGMGPRLEELEVAMNRAAEAAVPMASNLLMDAARNLSVSDARKILTGGETSVTQFFADKTRTPLTTSFLPVVRKATAQVALAEKVDRVTKKGASMGLVKPEDATIDHYVTRKSLDGLYLVIGEEERRIRRDPVGTGSAILGKVFGALR
ncbi:MAG TPA: DUF4197 domain-containing protein [Ramlibacter sp.]|nr:DUF4197 domain-containing protein [Ramlibacter sp.]